MFVSCAFSVNSVFFANCSCKKCVELEDILAQKDHDREIRVAREFYKNAPRISCVSKQKSNENICRRSLENKNSKNWKLLNKTNGRCWYCGIILDLSCDVRTDSFTRDHVIPNGDNSISNLVAACRSCNSVKGNRSVEYLRRRMSQRDSGIPKFSANQKEWIKRELGVDIDSDKRFQGTLIKFYGETL